MGGYVLEREGNKRPQAFVQKARGEKLVQRIKRFESVFSNCYDSYLKSHDGIAPDLFQMKKLVSNDLEYGENWISQLLNFVYVEAALERHPVYRLDRLIYFVRK